MNIKGAEECIKMGPTQESSRCSAPRLANPFSGKAVLTNTMFLRGPSERELDARHQVVLRGCLIGWTIADAP